jgi:hypothetical protein
LTNGFEISGRSNVTSKKTLNAKNLEALGADRLAELLMEISRGNAAAKRRLRLELAGAQSPSEVAKEVRKRLTTIARSRSFVDWQNRRTLVEDLETQRCAIVGQVAKADSAEALELIWRFMSLANSVFGRCDDSSGTVIGIFHAACRDLGEIAQVVKPAPEVLAEKRNTRRFTFSIRQGTHEPCQDFTDLIGAILLNEMDSLHSHFGLIAPGPAKFTLAAS